MIEKLESIGAISPISKEEKTPSTEIYNPEGSLFGSIFESAVQNVRDTNDEHVKNQYLLATGQLDNPASLMIAATKYSTSVNLLVQLRNRALEAYNELTRMNM